MLLLSYGLYFVCHGYLHAPLTSSILFSSRSEYFYKTELLLSRNEYFYKDEIVNSLFERYKILSYYLLFNSVIVNDAHLI